jgi:hypothetical protein
MDLISSINGDGDFASNTQTRYFNRLDCGFDQQGSSTGGTGGTGGAGGMGGAAGGGGGTGGAGGSLAFASQKGSPQATTFQIRLDNSAGAVSEVFLWVGGQDSKCNEATSRNQTNARCAEIAGNPRVVGSNFLVSDLTLQDLLNAEAGSTPIVTCDSSGLQGTPYEIYVFRNQAPGGTDVDPSSYGIAEFRVDVQAPNKPNVDTTPQRQTNFDISWATPDPPDLIQFWNFYVSDSSDPSTADSLGITTPTGTYSQTISSTELGLSPGETAYIFVSAFDQAFVSDPPSQSNESQLSSPVMVTNVAVTGFCDATGDCSGCSVSPMILSDGRPSEGLWLFGLLLVVFGAWRLRR